MTFATMLLGTLVIVVVQRGLKEVERWLKGSASARRRTAGGTGND